MKPLILHTVLPVFFVFQLGTSVLVDDYEDDTDEIFGLSRNNNNNGKSLTPPNFINNDDDVDPLMQTACDDEEVHLRCLSDEYVDVTAAIYSRAPRTQCIHNTQPSTSFLENHDGRDDQVNQDVGTVIDGEHSVRDPCYSVTKKALAIVAERCKNKRLCKFTVDSLFRRAKLPKACRDVNKWLKVQYLCVDKNVRRKQHNRKQNGKQEFLESDEIPENSSRNNNKHSNGFKGESKTSAYENKLKPTTNGRQSGSSITKSQKTYVQKIIEHTSQPAKNQDLLLISKWLRNAVNVTNKPETKDLMFVAKKLANFHVNINLPHKQNEDDAITVIDKILEHTTEAVTSITNTPQSSLTAHQKSELFTNCLKSIKNIGFLFISTYWLATGRQMQNPITTYEKNYIWLAYLSNELPKQQKISYYQENYNSQHPSIQYPNSLSSVKSIHNSIEFVPETIKTADDELVILSQLSDAIWFFDDKIKSSSILFAEKMEAKMFNRKMFSVDFEQTGTNRAVARKDSLFVNFQQTYQDSMNFGKCAAWDFKTGEWETDYCETLEKGRKNEEFSYIKCRCNTYSAYALVEDDEIPVRIPTFGSNFDEKNENIENSDFEENSEDFVDNFREISLFSSENPSFFKHASNDEKMIRMVLIGGAVACAIMLQAACLLTFSIAIVLLRKTKSEHAGSLKKTLNEKRQAVFAFLMAGVGLMLKYSEVNHGGNVFVFFKIAAMVWLIFVQNTLKNQTLETGMNSSSSTNSNSLIFLKTTISWIVAPAIITTGFIFFKNYDMFVIGVSFIITIFTIIISRFACDISFIVILSFLSLCSNLLIVEIQQTLNSSIPASIFAGFFEFAQSLAILGFWCLTEANCRNVIDRVITCRWKELRETGYLDTTLGSKTTGGETGSTQECNVDSRIDEKLGNCDENSEFLFIRGDQLVHALQPNQRIVGSEPICAGVIAENNIQVPRFTTRKINNTTTGNKNMMQAASNSQFLNQTMQAHHLHNSQSQNNFKNSQSHFSTQQFRSQYSPGKDSGVEDFENNSNSNCYYTQPEQLYRDPNHVSNVPNVQNSSSFNVPGSFVNL